MVESCDVDEVEIFASDQSNGSQVNSDLVDDAADCNFNQNPSCLKSL